MKQDKNLLTIFSQVKDHRRDLGKEHSLNEILLIGVISVICGADSWNDMEQYGRAKFDFLKTLQQNGTLITRIILIIIGLKLKIEKMPSCLELYNFKNLQHHL